MVVIGITGPTGAGKTTALNEIEQLGGAIVDCDAVYHRLLNSNDALQKELQEQFGPLTDETGCFNRKKLGAVVFRDPTALAQLNAIVYPHITQAVEELLVQARRNGNSVAAVDGITLLESGLGKRCDTTVAILAPVEDRVRRICRREGISEEYARSRVAAQKPDSYFRENCSYTLVNDCPDAQNFASKARALFRYILEHYEHRTSKGGNCMKENTEKTKGKQLREALLYDRKNGYDRISQDEIKEMEEYCTAYKQYLDAGKTERECVDRTIALAEAAGFRAYTRGMTLKAGDRVYRVNREKSVILAVMGKKGLEHGVNIGAAHIDSPRLDLKQNPLYEAEELAFFKTHYYGGIRKYQWVTIPLELHGVVALKNGSTVRVSVGNGEGDPLFTIDDLLPHLGADQSKKPLGEAIPGETLNILVGSRPLADDDGSDRVKIAVLELLNRKYGITEEDFISAELSAVPAFRACDIGFDRSLIGAYGHDDRVCAYATLAALLQLTVPERTAVCVLADKEEIGSTGVTGMKSFAFDTFMKDLCNVQGVSLEVCYENSFCLSADVTAAYDPNFAEVYEKRNSAFVNYGMGLCKYTGSRGKSGASDASAEVVGYVRRVLDEAGVVWQMAELGKVDQGGGGTVAQYMANRNIDTIDAGVPVLSMHAPFETVGKFDCYMTYRGMKAVFEAV